jgi:hypothetical protein
MQTPFFGYHPKFLIMTPSAKFVLNKGFGHAKEAILRQYPTLVSHKSPLRRELIGNADFVCIRELIGRNLFRRKGRNEAGDKAWCGEYTKPGSRVELSVWRNEYHATKQKTVLLTKQNSKRQEKKWDNWRKNTLK